MPNRMLLQDIVIATWKVRKKKIRKKKAAREMSSAWCADVQNLAACVGETIALELVPWTCAIDDSKKTLEGGGPSILTCMPAYLQLTRTPSARSATSKVRVS